MLRRLGMTRLIGHNAPVMGFPEFFYLTAGLLFSLITGVGIAVFFYYSPPSGLPAVARGFRLPSLIVLALGGA
jgi:hypothetical protein